MGFRTGGTIHLSAIVGVTIASEFLAHVGGGCDDAVPHQLGHAAVQGPVLVQAVHDEVKDLGRPAAYCRGSVWL